jgi:hypothetical protein
MAVNMPEIIVKLPGASAIAMKSKPTLKKERRMHGALPLYKWYILTSVVEFANRTSKLSPGSRPKSRELNKLIHCFHKDGA